MKLTRRAEGTVVGRASRSGTALAMRPLSRAGYKIGAVLQLFRRDGLDLRGKRVLDIGSSTGGFTEAVLAVGAKAVVAVEKGTRQMKAPLRFDPRVELHEKTDIFEFDLKNADGEWPEVILADVSFVSLRKVLTDVKAKLAPTVRPEFLVMLKPQFEARKEQLRAGIIKNNKIRREIIVEFEAFLKRNGFVIVAKKDNVLAGRFGNVERFYYLRLAKTR